MTASPQPCPLPPPAYILAGGRSSRFPGDKALAEIQGQPQLLRLSEQLRQQGHQVSVVADRSDRYTRLGIKCLADIYPQCGPLSGLITGLQARLEQYGPGWSLAIGCDQLEWRAEWLVGFEAVLSGKHASGVHIALWTHCQAGTPEHPDPIPGLYHTDLVADLHHHCQNGNLSLRSIIRGAANKVWYIRGKMQPRDYSFNTSEQLAELLKQNLPSSPKS